RKVTASDSSGDQFGSQYSEGRRRPGPIRPVSSGIAPWCRLFGPSPARHEGSIKNVHCEGRWQRVSRVLGGAPADLLDEVVRRQGAIVSKRTTVERYSEVGAVMPEQLDA